MSFTQPIVFNISATYAIFDPKAMESMASHAREAANSAAIIDKRTPPKIVETPADRKRTFSQCENSSGETTNPDSYSVADSVLTQVSTAPSASASAPVSAPRSVTAKPQLSSRTSVPSSNSPMDEDTSHSVSAHDSIDQQSITISRPNQYPEIIVIDDDDDDDDQSMNEYIKKESDGKKQTYPESETQKKRSAVQKYHDNCKKIIEEDEKMILDEFEVDDEIIDLTPIMKYSRKEISPYQMKSKPEKIVTRSKTKPTSSSRSRSDYLFFPKSNETESSDNRRGRVEELPENDTENVTYSSMHQNFDKYSGSY